MEFIGEHLIRNVRTRIKASTRSASCSAKAFKDTECAEHGTILSINVIYKSIAHLSPLVSIVHVQKTNLLVTIYWASNHTEQRGGAGKCSYPSSLPILLLSFCRYLHPLSWSWELSPSPVSPFSCNRMLQHDRCRIPRCKDGRRELLAIESSSQLRLAR